MPDAEIESQIAAVLSESDGAPAHTAIAMLEGAIHRYAPPGSPLIGLADRAQKTRIGDLHTTLDHHAECLADILNGLLSDYKGGRIRDFRAEARVEVEGDVLGLADELLNEGRKDPAAVIAGAVLEQHVRRFAEVNKVSVLRQDGKFKFFVPLVEEIVAAGHLSKIEGTSLRAWFTLRDSAAHGEFSAYDGPYVRNTIDGIRQFIQRHPA